MALRHQIGLLQGSAGKRLKLTSGDRLLWICLIFGIVADVTMNEPDPADALAQKQCLYVLRVTKP